MLDSQLIGGFALFGLALLGINEPSIPIWVVTGGAAIIGSTISAGWRINNGSIDRFWTGFLAVISGIPFALAVGYWLARTAGLSGVEIAFPVYIMSMVGAKATSYLSTKADIGEAIGALIKKYSGVSKGNDNG